MSTLPVALVTGASRGLGRGIALKLAADGFSIAVNYAGNRQAADETCAECVRLAPDKAQKFIPIQADISSRADRERMVAEVQAAFGRLDALVNNAGIPTRVRGDITEATEESFETVMKTNLQGPYFLTQTVVNLWRSRKFEPLENRGFKVIFVTSISAYTASTNRGDYCISKAGLAMAVQLWASRLADEGIQVFEIRPGIMATDMTSGVKEKYDKLIAAGIVPMKRWGSGDDVGRAASALLGGQFPYSTGQVINVDGGFQLRTL
jgi:NAD(P)-dependent dehydrogenase (short-subunit alcohol dehydrogenase family)